jgi:hypothetical protein
MIIIKRFLFLSILITLSSSKTNLFTIALPIHKTAPVTIITLLLKHI